MSRLVLNLLSLAVMTRFHDVFTQNSTNNQPCRNVVYHVQSIHQDNSGQTSDALLAHLVSAVSKQALDMKEMEHKLQKQQEDIMKHADDVKRLKLELKNQLNSHTDHIRKIEKKHADDIDDIAINQTASPLVGFHVALTHSQSSLTKIEFDRVISNYGNGWNSIMHTFKVPVKGVYFLSLTIADGKSGKSSHAVSRLMRGTQSLQYVHTSSGNSLEASTTSTVIKLDTGDQIYAEHHGGIIFSNILLDSLSKH